MRTMRCVYKIENIELHEYVPTLFSPLYCNFEPMSLVRRIRFLFDYLHKRAYRVYYLKVDNDIVGYCFITPGGRRLNCSTNEDIVVGPYYIQERYRGKGLSEILINTSLANSAYSYKTAYAWVFKKNIPSIKACEACGFIKYGELNVVGKIRRLVEVPNGKYIIFMKKNG